MNPSKKQLELEQSIFSISGYNKLSRNNKLREKGRESETPYARNMIEAGLDALTKALKLYVEQSMTGKAGVRAVASKYIAQFPDLDVVSFIAFKVIIDNTSLEKPTTTVAINIGQMLEDEMRYTIFEQLDPKYFKNIKNHTRDTNHTRYKKNMVRTHMSKKGIEFETWKKEDKLKIGLVLIDLVMINVGMVKMINKRVGKGLLSCLVFTEVTMKWIQKGRANRIAAYPQYLPCYDKPKPYTTLSDGGFYTERLRTKAIKTTNPETLKRLQEENLTVCLQALNLASSTAWGVNKFVFDTLVYCWEEGIEVGGLINKEPLELPPKPDDWNDKEKTKTWRYHAGLTHDTNHKNKVKRYQILSIIDTAKKFLGEKFYHVYQMDFTSRFYPVTAHFHPQGTDIARALHQFYEGGEIKTKRQLDWLAIAGANAFGMSKCSYEERLEWAYIEGQDYAEQVALDPIENLDIWGNASDPFQFLAWCKEWHDFMKSGGLNSGFISRYCCCLDGTNNGYQHIAGLVSCKELAGKVNLQYSRQPQDLYKEVLDKVLVLLKNDTTIQGRLWFEQREKLTRKFIKKPVLMIPYNSTTFGIANHVERYFVNENVSMAKNFKNNFYLATIIETAVSMISPESIKLLKYLSKIAVCFNKENKTISWNTPSGFLVQQKYFVNNSKIIRTKLSNQSMRLNLAEPTLQVDKRKQAQGFPSNYIHSFDAAHLQLSLVEASKMGIEQFCIIHDCFGSPASDLDRLIECVKQTFFYIYSDNNLDNLHHQVAEQLSDTKGLPPALLMGDFDITDVLTAPYIFT